MFKPDALLEAKVAHEGGHDVCNDSSGFSRKRKRRESEAISPCEDGKRNFSLQLERIDSQA